MKLERRGRRKEKDAVGHDAREPREGRPPSAFEDTQVLSLIVFRCRLLHAFLHRPTTTPRRLSAKPSRILLCLYRDCLLPGWTVLCRRTIRFETTLLHVWMGQRSESSWRNYRLVGKSPTPRDGEFIVASWIPLLPIQFRQSGSRMRKETTDCLCGSNAICF